jgi:hypothetical protein
MRAWMCQNAVTGGHCTTLTTLGESTNPEVRTGIMYMYLNVRFCSLATRECLQHSRVTQTNR